MEFDSQGTPLMAAASQPKRSDLVAEEIKRLITAKNLLPGDKLPRESELQSMFAVSKSTIREALKSLEVQGLLKVSTGPGGGGMVVEVPLDRTFQLMQNYLFFKEVRIEDIYQVRKLLEPELAASAVPHLTDAHFAALEHNIQCCDPMAEHVEDPLAQRQEEMNFHDIFADACPNSFLRFSCEMINQMIRQLTVFDNEMPLEEQARFGVSNTQFHKQILQAARARDAQRVRELMSEHMHDCMRSVTRMHGKLKGRLILDSEISRRTVARNARRAGRRKAEA
ncbi:MULTISPECIES: FadR/GntR family transcriptional regulator [unclassified Bordetella]|uniref:FadR/GntR family transcriptional regulator n=1 Tax=unclassified Bordetella TaxID=2630031 RepID=UPI00132AF92C|nr:MULTISPECIES: FadR/GntR family transcriptional regulator [unclassified Bordetella]MVW73123.1 FCD domain-containing protein [Bordetella sp. 15P40C-2]MVW79959.1 FCD domain-containing protein [Bordetella sp. 02P26C-1]